MDRTIESYFKKKEIKSLKNLGSPIVVNEGDDNEGEGSSHHLRNLLENQHVQSGKEGEYDDMTSSRPLKCPRMGCDQPKEFEKHQFDDGFDVNNLEIDPGLRPQIWNCCSEEKRDLIRRAYLDRGPYKFKFEDKDYPLNNDKKHPRRFKYNWFELFPDWLEYSPTKDAAFCLPCYLFHKPSGRFGSDVFTVTGFREWKKVRNGIKCAFLKHVGVNPCSPHKNAAKMCIALLDHSSHIQHAFQLQRTENVMKNRLRLKASIESVRWLVFQACAFRGHDESLHSKNQGNFLEMLKLLASYNPEVANVIQNAHYNSKYTSHHIQKEILHIFAKKVRSYIRNEIGDSKFCVLVDESRDEAKREQMSIVLRFVDIHGFIKERFFDLVHVRDTTASNLKSELCNVLSLHNLAICNIRGQGYDGASNMRGEWNGLKALFLNDCPYAYYIHCFAHRLQLALVASQRENISIHQFFTNLLFIVNIITSSSKRHDQLQASKVAEITHLLELDAIETGKGMNQIGTLKRAGDTRWSSHFLSVCSFIQMFDATFSVLQGIVNDPKSNYRQKGDADTASSYMTSFDFVLILHLVRRIMGITYDLCQALQKCSQDVVNALQLVSTTKVLIQRLRDDGWNDLLEEVKTFCEQHLIDFPSMDAPYRARRGKQQRDMTLEEYYRIDIFLSTIDKQLAELNNRFNENSMDILTLGTSLVPRDGYKKFDIDRICSLVDKYYPADFSDQEKIILKLQLEHFIIEARSHEKLRNLSTIPELCIALAETKKSSIFFLVDRIVRLVLTLPVSTASTERAFSAMKIVKTRLRNKMEDGYLADSLVMYIEKEIAKEFDTDSIIDAFKNMKERNAEL